MTSCKLRAKLRAVFKNKKSANPYEFALLGTSVTRPLLNIREKPTLFSKLRAILRADFLTF